MSHNPYAFPFSPPIDEEGDRAVGYPYPELGMTLRDYFVAKAVVGLLSSASLTSWDDTTLRSRHVVDIVTLAGQIADAMLAEREKNGGGA